MSKEKITVSKELWRDIKRALNESLCALNDASSVVDPGDEEANAYENEIGFLESVVADVEAVDEETV